MSDLIDKANEQAEWHRQKAIENALKKQPALSAVFVTKNGEQVQLCADCDAQIPTARLLAVPDAVLCIECQEVWEKHL